MNATVVISGIGLLSGLGEGADAHWQKLGQKQAGDDKTSAAAWPVVDEERFAPYPVHLLGPVDFSTQIPKKGDLRQMEPWQRIGTFTAGLALEDAGIAGCLELLDETHLIAAAGSGERDTSTDMKVLETISARDDGEVRANEILPSNLRPTLFLAQLSNLLAGNISIVHKVTGSSRTFMGEEMAGVAAIETATRRIMAGQGKLFLVGGAFNSEREDALLNFELGGMLAQNPFKPIWQRAGTGPAAGFAAASVGAFLVLEERAHAEARGAKIYAEIASIQSDRCNRKDGAAARIAGEQFAVIKDSLGEGPIAILSGASGAEPATSEELGFLEGLDELGHPPVVRAYGTGLGHGVEAHFPLGVALAGLALRNGSFFPPFEQSGVEQEFVGQPENILVTSWGHWRGEALAVVCKAGS